MIPVGLRQGPIYLDYNATTPVDPAVTEALLPYLSGEFGNPSSTHGYGAAPREALAAARQEILSLLGAERGRIVFTGSGSEADNLAIRGVALAAGRDRPHVITQQTEHPAVLAACASLRQRHAAEITCLPVDAGGLVDPESLARALRPATVLVSIMAANNETGALQPITELARITHGHGALFHTDAAQAAGKIDLAATLGADLVTVVGHKMYAPKGIAALYVAPGVALEPLVHGGGQEQGLRAGTENVAFAVALGAAARLAADEIADGGPDRLRRLRDRLHDALVDGLGDRLVLNGPGGPRLPNTLNVSLLGSTGHGLLAAVPQIAASVGSACHSGEHRPSPVLTAMGLPAERSLAAVRLSVGRWSDEAQIDQAAALLVKAAGRARDTPPGAAEG